MCLIHIPTNILYNTNAMVSITKITDNFKTLIIITFCIIDSIETGTSQLPWSTIGRGWGSL